MKRLVLSILLLAAPLLATAQTNRSAELDKAYEETRAAYLALQEAEKRRDQGLESQPGERQGTAGGGGSRPNDAYFGRQAQLEHEVELARKRYEAAAKRWNDLK
jgi:Ni/Co efflux regulator RcnB